MKTIIAMFVIAAALACGQPPDVSEKQGAIGAEWCAVPDCTNCYQGCAQLNVCPDGCRWAAPPPVTYPYCDCRDTSHSWCDPNPANYCAQCACGDANHSWCDQRPGFCHPPTQPWPVLETCEDKYGWFEFTESYVGGPLMPVPTGGGLLASCRYYLWYYHEWSPIDYGQCSFQAPNRLTGQIVPWRCVLDAVFEYNASSMFH